MRATWGYVLLPVSALVVVCAAAASQELAGIRAEPLRVIEWPRELGTVSEGAAFLDEADRTALDQARQYLWDMAEDDAITDAEAYWLARSFFHPNTFVQGYGGAAVARSLANPECAWANDYSRRLVVGAVLELLTTDDDRALLALNVLHECGLLDHDARVRAMAVGIYEREKDARRRLFFSRALGLEDGGEAMKTP